MNPALLIGAGAVLLLSSGKKSKARKSKSCPQLRPGSGHIAGFDYEEIATGGADLRERLPIVVFFHSLGAKPSSFFKYFDTVKWKARIIFPSGNDSFGSGPAWWSLRSKTEDQGGLAQQMDSQARAMSGFVGEVNRCLGGVGKPIVTGHSQGGMMTYAVAAEAPGLVRAAVPVSGWLPTQLWPRTLPPTIAIHGDKDRTVDFARTEDFVSRAKSAGLPIEWHPIDGKGHGFSGSLKLEWLEVLDSFLN